MTSTALPSTPLKYHPDISDRVAVQAVLRGDKEMFRVIVQRYNQQLYRVGMAYLRNHAETEDAMQNTYLNAFRHLRRFAGNAAFATWLTRIMINECLMLLRRNRHRAAEPIEEHTAYAEPADTAAPPNAKLHSAEMKTLLEQAIQRLPRRYRAVYLLREVQRLSTQETAASLGLTPANVKVSLHRAREGLKTELIKTAAGAELFPYPAMYCDPMTKRVMRTVLGG